MIIGGREHIHEEEQQTLIRSIRFEHTDNLLGIKALDIGNRDLGTQLSVLSVGLHKLVQAGDELIRLNSCKELNHDFLSDGVRVQHDSLAVIDACIVLKSTSVQTYLFTELSNRCLVVVSEHIQLENTFCHVWLLLEVNPEKLCL